MFTNSVNHLTKSQMKSLLKEEATTLWDDGAADHLERCSECRQAVEAMAAAPDLWQRAGELCSPAVGASLSTDQRTKPLHLSADTDATGSSFNPELSLQALLDKPSHPDWLGSLGGYDVEREIGRGGMGVVFKAYDRELNRVLAIKILAPWLAQNGAARQRFAREAKAAAAVIHPNVVPIYGISSNEKTPYLIMPFVGGPSLQRLVDEQGPLEEKEIVRIALQVSGALGAAHAQGLVHRDIKPANILVEEGVNRVLVTDFGLARAVDDASATQSGYFVGTPNYMSPEQALGRRVDSRSDLFSLGSVIYFMATGRMPFRADSPISVLHRITKDQPADVRAINCDISTTLSHIILKLHEKDVDHRFQGAGVLHQVLEGYLAYLHQPDISQPPTISLHRSEGELEPRPELSDETLSPNKVRTRTKVLSIAAAATVALGIAVASEWTSFPGWNWFPSTAFAAQAQDPVESDSEATDDEAGDAGSQDPQTPSDGTGEQGSSGSGSSGSGSSGSGSSGSGSSGSGSSGSGSSGSGSGALVSDQPESWPELIAEDGIPGTFVTVEREYADQHIDGYTLYLPASFSEDSETYPVLVFLHGGLLVGGKASRVNQWDLPIEVKKHQAQDSQLSTYLTDTFIIACPHLVQGEFYQNESAIQTIIGEIQSKYRGDPSRVYLTGLSRGGSGTWGLASRMPGVFAAAVPIGGRVNGIDSVENLRATPLWIAHNKHDNIVAYEPAAKISSQLEEIDEQRFHHVDLAGGLDVEDLRHSRLFTWRDTEDHNAWTELYTNPLFYRWLLVQSL